MALQDAQANGFVASIKGGETKMGIMHSCYGKHPRTRSQYSHSLSSYTLLFQMRSITDHILSSLCSGVGALVAPIVGTQFARMRLWSLHYAVAAGVGLINLIGLLLIFRFMTQERKHIILYTVTLMKY